MNAYLFNFYLEDILDNGRGMDPNELRQCMSLSYPAKSSIADTIEPCKFSLIFFTLSLYMSTHTHGRMYISFIMLLWLSHTLETCFINYVCPLIYYQSFVFQMEIVFWLTLWELAMVSLFLLDLVGIIWEGLWTLQILSCFF